LDRPTVSVIVLNYNGCKWLGPCLDALATQRDAPAFEVIVVDNGSGDGSVAFVTGQYPSVRLVETQANLGFAGGNNAGARATRGMFLAFLNNDTVAAPDWLSKLHRALVQRRDMAIVTSRLVRLDDPSIVDSAGDGYLRAGGAYKRGYGQPVDGFLESCEVFGACGAAFMIRRETFHELGGFDERLFMVYEDVDLSYRARLAGHQCWYVADAVVQHAGSGSLGPESAMAVFYGQRNLEWVWAKNTPWPLILRTAPSHLAYSLAGVLHYLRRGQLAAAIQGKIAAVKELPRVMRERRVLQGRHSVRPSTIEALMDRGWISLKRAEKSARIHLPDHQERGLR
jgi:N-acetylglucosaminyl-diphospho-decaprenol L-rhamnosyltransferase